MTGPILLTRPLKDSQDLARELESQGFESFIEPMLEIKKLNFILPNLDVYDALIFTSAHAIPYINSNIPVYTVGDRTAKAAKEKGFKNVRSAERDIHALIKLVSRDISKSKKLLYLRGKHATADLADFLPDHIIDQITVYDMQKAPNLTTECMELLKNGSINIVLFFSRRTAQNFMELAAKNRLFPVLSRIKALSISDGVLECLQAAPWAENHVAETPDRAGILKKLKTL